jgi:hypothetical protein
MKIFSWLSDKWKQYRLNHHDCERNLVLLENYRTEYVSNGCSAVTTVSMCKCKICDKRIDID